MYEPLIVEDDTPDTVGGAKYVNPVNAAVALPFLVTMTFCVPAVFAGATTVICVALTQVTLVPAVPPNVTETPVALDPITGDVIVKTVPPAVDAFANPAEFTTEEIGAEVIIGGDASATAPVLLATFVATVIPATAVELASGLIIPAMVMLLVVPVAVVAHDAGRVTTTVLLVLSPTPVAPPAHPAPVKPVPKVIAGDVGMTYLSTPVWPLPNVAVIVLPAAINTLVRN